MRKTILFWCLCLVPYAQAGESIDCSGIESDEARLECYDEAAKHSSVSEPDSRPGGEEPATPGQAVAPEVDPEPAPAATPEELFGKSEEDKNAAIAVAAGVEEVKNVTAAVTRVVEDPYGKITIDLDNGQRWRQVRVEPFKVSVGDEVVVRSAIMRSFSMQLKSGGRKTKVRRVD